MTAEEVAAKLGGVVTPSTPEEIAQRKAEIEAGAKWRAEMVAKIKALPEPERSKQWERWQNRLAKWRN